MDHAQRIIHVNGSGFPYIITHMDLESLLPQSCHNKWIDGQLLEWLRTLIASASSPSILEASTDRLATCEASSKS